ncbi:hypothetical protein Tco_0891346 [Tanacetum coccineum]|uniref:Uncharacterized protein n=1 Tax=Tanacetum coccineum TaxID=301880 RepID=A0ABQ5C4G0_9ASTR
MRSLQMDDDDDEISNLVDLSNVCALWWMEMTRTLALVDVDGKISMLDLVDHFRYLSVSKMVEKEDIKIHIVEEDKLNLIDMVEDDKLTEIIREVFVKLLLDSFGKLSISLYDSTLYVLLCYVLFITVIGFKGELHENTEDREILFLYCFAFSVSLLFTPLCCDDIHDVTPRVSALAGCDKGSLQMVCIDL